MNKHAQNGIIASVSANFSCVTKSNLHVLFIEMQIKSCHFIICLLSVWQQNSTLVWRDPYGVTKRAAYANRIRYPARG